MLTRIRNCYIGKTIIEKPSGKAYEIEKIYPHYVRARRLYDPDEEHFVTERKCFDLGLLVMMGYEEGGDPREEKEGIYGTPRC